MRLVQSLERPAETIDREARPVRDQDYLRASHLGRLLAEIPYPPPRVAD